MPCEVTDADRLAGSSNPWLVRAAILATFLFVAGCAELPPKNPELESFAAASNPQSFLAQTAKRSLEGSSSGQSGFALLPIAGTALQTRQDIIEDAATSVDAQYYLLSEDKTGFSVLAALEDKATAGVRVRLLVDDISSVSASKSLRCLAANPKFEIRSFNPFAGNSDLPLARWLSILSDFGRVDHRMHNKLLIADNSFAIAGGRNLADEYFMNSSEANFVDMDVLMAGPVVGQLSASFDDYWNSKYSIPLSADKAGSGRCVSESASADLAPTTYSRPSHLHYTLLPAQLKAGLVPMTFAPAHVLADPVSKASGGNAQSRAGTVRAFFGDVVRDANSDVLVVTPYDVPGPEGMKAIENLHARGVQLQMVTNSFESTDNPLAHAVYARYRRPLLRAGVELYEMAPELIKKQGYLGIFKGSKSRLHAKLAVIDGHEVFFGSMNLDNRSERVNTELGILVDSKELAQQIIELIDIKDSFFRLKLENDGHTIDWISPGSPGDETVSRTEPDEDVFGSLQEWLFSELVPEGEL